MSFDRAQQRFDADYPEYLEDGYSSELDDEDLRDPDAEREWRMELEDGDYGDETRRR